MPSQVFDAEAEARIAQLVRRGAAMSRSPTSTTTPRPRSVGASATTSNGAARERIGQRTRFDNVSASKRPSEATAKPATGRGLRPPALSEAKLPPSQHAVASNADRAESQDADAPSRAEKPSSQLSVGTTAAPEAVAAAMYRQERDDRLYVERLFVIREEHHGRGHVHMSENNARSAVAAMHELERRMLSVAEEHAAQQAALQVRLEDSSHIARLRRQLRDGLDRLEEERAAVVALQREVGVADEERKSAIAEEREAWASDKALLLQRIDALEATITKLRVSGAAPTLSPLPSTVVQPAHAPVPRSRSGESTRSSFDRVPAPTVYGDASVPCIEETTVPPPRPELTVDGRPQSNTAPQSRADERVRQEFWRSQQRSPSAASAEAAQSADRAGDVSTHTAWSAERPTKNTRDELQEQRTLSAASLRPAHSAMERTRLLLARASSALNSSQPSH